jgi:hypothetical protein
MDGLYSHPPRWAPRRCQSARPTVKNSAERVRGTRPESARCWSNTNFAPCTFRPRESDPPSSGSIARSKSGPEHEARSGPRALRSNSAEPTFHSAARKMQLASSAKIPGETAPQRLRRGRDFLSAVCRSATRVHLVVKRATRGLGDSNWPNGVGNRYSALHDIDRHRRHRRFNASGSALSRRRGLRPI